MEDKGWIMLRTLLNRYHGGAADKLLKSLSQEDVKTVLSQNIQSKDTSAVFIKPEEVLQKVHYSWLVAPIQKTPEALQPYFLAALSESQAQGVCSLLGKTYEAQPLASPIRDFLLTTLYSKLGAKSLIPVPLLPETPFKVLIGLEKQDLINLINLLGTYELVPLVKKVVDKQKLRSLYKCLTKLELQFIRSNLHYPEHKVLPNEIDFEKWNGDRNTMKKALHTRGLIRLAKALSGQSPHLIWHLTHILDTGRSSLFLKNWSKEEIPNLTSMLVTQVIHSLNYLRKSEKAES